MSGLARERLGGHACGKPCRTCSAIRWSASRWSRCGRKLIDGRGPDRLVTALEVLLHPSRFIQAEAAAA